MPAGPDETPSRDAGRPAAERAGASYRVLARKYRPQTFAELLGQDALVRTLSNAFREGRVAHAFILTGVRGVGKTSTARILARGLNCLGEDGRGGPTLQPCGRCEPCRAIAESRHLDVLEVDAASRTGVDDMRELLDGVAYRPVGARYKIYIIDEVHMLSKSAFNALLKTLEEPPEHVKFVFATTEIQKVPITVLSRCQRFDLRRVPEDLLLAHFQRILAAEDVAADDAALRLIARAAEGSVRDGLSLLDQAIAHGDSRLDADGVRELLGLSSRLGQFAILDATLAGDVPAALEALGRAYEAGADPVLLLQDLLELTHWLTRLRLLPELADDPTFPEAERQQGRAMAGKLDMPVLSRLWQALLKGLPEVRTAPNGLAALEMLLIRLAYMSRLPTPEELVRQLGGEPAPPRAAPPRGLG
ncbi:MAG: DNA polymerase III subunit gamma/tau, partial [Alphaproteobacteria bacterium]|nr:DNA polymerase III subunit gamma/tau [Alphaproteobacteria bacterium]